MVEQPRPSKPTGLIDLRASFTKAAEDIPAQFSQIKNMAQDFIKMIESGEAMEQIQKFFAEIGDVLGSKSGDSSSGAAAPSAPPPTAPQAAARPAAPAPIEP